MTIDVGGGRATGDSGRSRGKQRCVRCIQCGIRRERELLARIEIIIIIIMAN